MGGTLYVLVVEEVGRGLHDERQRGLDESPAGHAAYDGAQRGRQLVQDVLHEHSFHGL